MSRLKGQERFHSFDDVIAALRNDSTSFASFYWSIGRPPKLKGPAQRGATMSATAQTLRPPSRTLMILEGRGLHGFCAFLGPWALRSMAPSGHFHPVLA